MDSIVYTILQTHLTLCNTQYWNHSSLTVKVRQWSYISQSIRSENLFCFVMNEMTYLPQNASVWCVKFSWKIMAIIKRQIYRLWSRFVSFVTWSWQHLCKFVPTFTAYKTANFIIWAGVFQSKESYFLCLNVNARKNGNMQNWFDPITVSDWNKIAVWLDQLLGNFGLALYLN